jgi:hypothetical protein
VKQSSCDAIGEKDSAIGEQKTLIGKKDKRIKELEMQHELDASERENTLGETENVD